MRSGSRTRIGRRTSRRRSNYEIRRLGDYPETKNFHDALIRLMTRSPTPLDLRQRLDVWRLLRASKALADQNERINYAADALDAGASREAQAVLEEFAAGKSAAQLDAKFNTALATAKTRVAAARRRLPRSRGRCQGRQCAAGADRRELQLCRRQLRQGGRDVSTGRPARRAGQGRTEDQPGCCAGAGR